MALFEAMRLIISGMHHAEKIFRWPEFADALKTFYYRPYFWNHAYALISVGGRNILETQKRNTVVSAVTTADNVSSYVFVHMPSVWSADRSFLVL